MRFASAILAVGLLGLSGCASAPVVAPPAPETLYLRLTPAQTAQRLSTWWEGKGHSMSTVAYGSNSMAPLVVSGDILMLEAYHPAEKCPKGTLVIFKRGAAQRGYPAMSAPMQSWLQARDAVTPIHRVREENEGAVFISGDNNLWPDGWFLKRDILWTAPAVIRIVATEGAK